MIRSLRVVIIGLMLGLIIIVGAQNILAQPPAISNYSQIVLDIENDTRNEDIAVMILNCGKYQFEYDDLYQGLKDTQYGEDLKIKAGVCHHNTLYYYGICEQARPNVTERSDMSFDCNLANMYLEMHGLSNESRPRDFVYHPEITQ